MQHGEESVPLASIQVKHNSEEKLKEDAVKLSIFNNDNNDITKIIQ